MATKNNNRSSGKKPVKSGGKKSFTDKKSSSRKDSAVGKSGERGTGYKKKSYGDEDKRKSSYGDRDSSKKFGSEKRPVKDKPDYGKKRFEDDDTSKKRSSGKSFSSDKRKSFGDRDSSKKFGSEKKSYGDKKSFGDKKPLREKPDYGMKKTADDTKKFGDKRVFDEKPSKKKSYSEDDGDTFAWKKSKVKDEELFSFKDHDKSKKRFTQEKQKYNSLNKRKPSTSSKEDDGTIRLNRYLSNAGVCSRREADQLIISGVVKINGKVVTELGTKVLPTDKVSYGDQTLKRENIVYLLLNKPKDYITTSDDPQKRRTVMELIRGAVKERLYPVGRLDRNTTGLLLFTNDGEMATKLTHPKNNIRKVYHVVTDQNVSKEDMDKMRAGMELEDGFIAPDDIEFVGTGHNKKDIGVEIHSGKNRIVRRMFEHLGYKVIKLDRVMFAGLNKKDLPRGKWRILTPKEISFLKML